jgi:hypothetical protein
MGRFITRRLWGIARNKSRVADAFWLASRPLADSRAQTVCRWLFATSDQILTWQRGWSKPAATPHTTARIQVHEADTTSAVSFTATQLAAKCVP